MSTVLLLVVLAGWIGVAFWWFVGQRSAPTDATGLFRRQLGTLERRTPGPYPGPRAAHPRVTALRRSEVQRRRRDIVAGLALLTGSTLVLGVVPQLRLLWVVSLVAGGLLAGYCYLLVQLKTMATEREMSGSFRSSSARVAPAYAVRPGARPVRRMVDTGYDYEPALLRRHAG